MKKIIIMLLLFLSVLPCFAEGRAGSFEIGVGYHGMIFDGTLTFNQPEPGKEDITEDIKKTLSSFAINFALIPYFTKSFGFGFYVNILFVSKEEAGIPVFPVAGVDFLMGPAFMLYNSEKTCVSFTPGMHMGYFAFFEDGSRQISKQIGSGQIGLGANVTGEYHFTPKVYIYARFQLSYDLYSWFSRGGTSGTHNPITGNSGGSAAEDGKGNISAWNINPYIGLGFTF